MYHVVAILYAEYLVTVNVHNFIIGCFELRVNVGQARIVSILRQHLDAACQITLIRSPEVGRAS